MVHTMQVGGWHGMLALDTMDEEMATRITLAMRAVAQDVAENGPHNMTPDRERDVDGQRMYRESMIELIDLIDNGSSAGS
ncbi:MAG: hypothetical protein JST22_21170 [Bacteroidetes bacterium]|nr:hypothetical protein [Bacteroidota bacterium]